MLLAGLLGYLSCYRFHQPLSALRPLPRLLPFAPPVLPTRPRWPAVGQLKLPEAHQAHSSGFRPEQVHLKARPGQAVVQEGWAEKGLFIIWLTVFQRLSSRSALFLASCGGPVSPNTRGPCNVLSVSQLVTSLFFILSSTSSRVARAVACVRACPCACSRAPVGVEVGDSVRWLKRVF